MGPYKKYTNYYYTIGVVFRGTVEDTELIDGLVFSQKTAGYGGPNKVEKAKIGLIQFCVSPPKTDMENQASRSRNEPYLLNLRFHMLVRF